MRVFTVQKQSATARFDQESCFDDTAQNYGPSFVLCSSSDGHTVGNDLASITITAVLYYFSPNQTTFCQLHVACYRRVGVIPNWIYAMILLLYSAKWGRSNPSLERLAWSDSCWVMCGRRKSIQIQVQFYTTVIKVSSDTTNVGDRISNCRSCC